MSSHRKRTPASLENAFTGRSRSAFPVKYLCITAERRVRHTCSLDEGWTVTASPVEPLSDPRSSAVICNLAFPLRDIKKTSRQPQDRQTDRSRESISKDVKGKRGSGGDQLRPSADQKRAAAAGEEGRKRVDQLCLTRSRIQQGKLTHFHSIYLSSRVNERKGERDWSGKSNTRSRLRMWM